MRHATEHPMRVGRSGPPSRARVDGRPGAGRERHADIEVAAMMAPVRGRYVSCMSDPGLGMIVFLVALFLAVVGATAFVVAIRHGGATERRDEEPPTP